MKTRKRKRERVVNSLPPSLSLSLSFLDNTKYTMADTINKNNKRGREEEGEEGEEEMRARKKRAQEKEEAEDAKRDAAADALSARLRWGDLSAKAEGEEEETETEDEEEEEKEDEKEEDVKIKLRRALYRLHNAQEACSPNDREACFDRAACLQHERAEEEFSNTLSYFLQVCEVNTLYHFLGLNDPKVSITYAVAWLLELEDLDFLVEVGGDVTLIEEGGEDVLTLLLQEMAGETILQDNETLGNFIDKCHFVKGELNRLRKA